MTKMNASIGRVTEDFCMIVLAYQNPLSSLFSMHVALSAEDFLMVSRMLD